MLLYHRLHRYNLRPKLSARRTHHLREGAKSASHRKRLPQQRVSAFFAILFIFALASISTLITFDYPYSAAR